MTPGTEVVWMWIPWPSAFHVYRASEPEHPVTFRRGDIADAEPATRGWRVAVDWIFA
jgi:hypothetical protein